MRSTEVNEPIRSNMLKIIKETGLKQNFVARKAGLPENALSQIGSGRRIIRPYEIPILAKALNVTPADLLKPLS